MLVGEKKFLARVAGFSAMEQGFPYGAQHQRRTRTNSLRSLRNPAMNTYAKEVVIRPTEGFSAIDLREVWVYRDLLWLLVWRDISVRYKQTVLGPLWFVIQPVLTTLVFTLVFGKVAQIPTAGVPPLLFYLCGLLAWNYFSQTFQST